MTAICSSRLAEQLAECGFRQTSDAFRRGPYLARLDSRWLTIETKATPNGRLLSPVAEAPGLWKTVRRSDGKLGRVFDLPADVAASAQSWDAQDGDAASPLSPLIDWAVASAAGRLPAGWTCLPHDQFDRVLPADQRTIAAGPFARQADLHVSDSRLAISVSLLRNLPETLAPARRAHLEALLCDIQTRSRIVRIVAEPALDQRTDPGDQGVTAEADLSGVPLFAAPLLLRIAQDSLRQVVSQCLAAIELLVNPAVTSTVWETPPTQHVAAERKRK